MNIIIHSFSQIPFKMLIKNSLYFLKIQNRLFKGCIADWKLDNEENMKKVVSSLG